LSGLPESAPAQRRVGAIGRAYCEYALAHPGQYRVLFGTLGTPEWNPRTLPGMEVFRMFRDEVARHVPREPDAVTVCLWAFLHGLVTLRTNRPSFPWPPIEELIDRAVAAHLG
jgi:hypothetical protein